ncbi:DEAD-domain-containing protein [Linnemannia elongata AG-77]|uniref:ATP-dependent RNA helicase n=1 Tax=Linnemannia elongata AG-77 TaxID=1314771 RepID=A0A197KAJ5_9FUNG|nr:DEAD-domain-containing protein [Linnemannia elongata AG-77]
MSRIISSLRPVMRLATSQASTLIRIPRTSLPAVQSAKAFPALTSYLQRSAGFHSQSTAFQAAQSVAAQVEETEEELPTRFDEIASLHPNTAKAIKGIFKYETMSKVQAEVLSLLPTDTDMFVKAKTGTGKTLAFLIPALETVNAKCDKKTLARGDLATILIVSPTRELAQQIADEARKLATSHRFNVHCLVGGESKGQQIRQLNNKRVDIVVGTPGRLNDMIESVREFREQLEGVKTLILDEADQLLDMGFKDSIESIVDALPKERQTLFFSATVSKQIKAIARTSLKPDFTFIDTVDPNEANTNLQVNQSFSVTPYEQQLPLLARIIEDHKKQNPNGKVMVFLPTTRGTQLYASLFEELTSYRLFSLHSKKSQEQRTRTSDRFRKSKGSIMFTSDVSARGVDYPDVSLVIQVGIPSSKEQYIHRIGRTGRAGKTGEGVLMITPMEKSFLDTMSDLPLTINETSKQIDEIMEDAQLMDKLAVAKQAQDPEMIHDAFTAYLGYYTGRTDVLTCPKRDILENAKQYVTSLGADEPPHLSEAFLSKLGLNQRSSRSSSSSRGGYSRGRDNGRDNYSRDRSSSRYGRDREYSNNNGSSARRTFDRNDRNDRNNSNRNDRGRDRREFSDRFFSKD